MMQYRLQDKTSNIKFNALGGSYKWILRKLQVDLKEVTSG